MSDDQLEPDRLYAAANPPPPQPISIDELMNSIEALQKKESDDKLLLESIGTTPADDLRSKLLSWAKTGFQNAYEIFKLDITPPDLCSDGVKRNMMDYVQYCSGKQIYEHISPLNEKTTGMSFGYMNYSTYITVVVSKA